MSDMIHVQPAVEQLRPFARWATAQTPKIRTVSPDTFAVPSRLFTEAPEAVLTGALVDGHRYVSPDDGDELTGVLAVPGELLPEVDASSYGPDSTPLDFAPLEDSGDSDSDSSDSSGDQDSASADGYLCDVCERPFPTARGRDTHRRMAHTEES